MFIIARSGDTYARLRFNTGPGGDIELSTTIDYRAEFLGSDREAWEQQFLKSVHDTTTVGSHMMDSDLFGYRSPWSEDWYDDWLQYTEEDSEAPLLKVVNHE